MITVDYSTYIDFPETVKQFAIYRMQLSGILANNLGIEVIHNLRIDPFNAYPSNYITNDSIICIGTVASGLKEKIYKDLFDDQYSNYFKHNKIKTILTFGSSKYTVFDNLRKQGIETISYKSHKNIVFEGGDLNV